MPDPKNELDRKPAATAAAKTATGVAAAPGAITPAPAIELRVNGESFRHTGATDMPLLWFLRDVLRLTGTKYGCGLGQCGACTVHVDGKAQRSCLMPMAALAGRDVTTIEGLATADALHVVQQAWIDEDVPQCGYCQAGQIMAAVDLLQRRPEPTDVEISQLTNLCRCGTYPRIRAAIQRASRGLAETKK
jgi:isoquinoline 1-oxidoreductase subunit alpha